MEQKILVVDDDASIQALLKRALTKHQYQVFSTYDGEEALRVALQEVPDVILLDQNLPGQKGDYVLHQLRANIRTRSVPVIFITGMNTLEDKVKGLSEGADDYLCKPFQLEELVARIESAIRRSKANLEASPLTKLPGNGIIERELARCLGSNRVFSVLYADLNDFKAYNDYYGFYKGDLVIQKTADVLVSCVDIAKDVVGHIGGDDFIIITEAEDVNELCQSIIRRFDGECRGFYSPEDFIKGFVTTQDRRGITHSFPLLSIGIGVVTNRLRPIKSLGEISAIGAEVKGVAKRLGGSAYFIDRRTDPYEAPQKIHPIIRETELELKASECPPPLMAPLFRDCCESRRPRGGGGPDT